MRRQFSLSKPRGVLELKINLSFSLLPIFLPYVFLRSTILFFSSKTDFLFCTTGEKRRLKHLLFFFFFFRPCDTCIHTFDMILKKKKKTEKDNNKKNQQNEGEMCYIRNTAIVFRFPRREKRPLGRALTLHPAHTNIWYTNIRKQNGKSWKEGGMEGGNRSH